MYRSNLDDYLDFLSCLSLSESTRPDQTDQIRSEDNLVNAKEKKDELDIKTDEILEQRI